MLTKSCTGRSETAATEAIIAAICSFSCSPEQSTTNRGSLAMDALPPGDAHSIPGEQEEGRRSASPCAAARCLHGRLRHAHATPLPPRPPNGYSYRQPG
jgi:hypothetical protein